MVQKVLLESACERKESIVKSWLKFLIETAEAFHSQMRSMVKL
jgi:hypothetical protein